MSGFVETLVASKIHPLDREEEKDDREKKMVAGGNGEHEDNNAMLKCDNELGFCLLNQPRKDKGGKRTPWRKRFILERLTINPVAAETSRGQDVQMVGISIVCPGRAEIALAQPFVSSPKAHLFTLKEGTKYRLSFTFIVSNRPVSGLKYENTLWKAGIRVDRCTVMLGSYKPREEPYLFQLEEETLPCGFLVRGLYTARIRVWDSEGRYYMDMQYYFNISKNWPSISS